MLSRFSSYGMEDRMDVECSFCTAILVQLTLRIKWVFYLEIQLELVSNVFNPFLNLLEPKNPWFPPLSRPKTNPLDFIILGITF